MRLILLISVILVAMLLSSCTATANISTHTITKTTPTPIANGLSLSLSLDATTYQPGQEVKMVIDETNTLPKKNRVSTVDKWPLSGLSLSLNPCGTNSFPLGVAIFQGDYTSADISTATPLLIIDPSVTWTCTVSPALTAYDFLPSSDLAAEIIVHEPNSEAFAINQSVWATYYWTGSGQNVSQHDFEPGVYTVVGGDEWGALVVKHFTVTK